jgi:membrane associated rhomboid family serine protease
LKHTDIRILKKTGMAEFRTRGFQSIPPVVKNLIIINVLVWLAQLTFGEQFTSMLSLHFYKSPDFGVWQLFTYMFLHSPEMFFHILFNMFALWMFGSALENIWGAKRFLIFYLICGLGAGLIQMMTNAIEWNIVEGQWVSQKITEAQYLVKARPIYNGIVLGASGAVMGLFAAFAYLFPNSPMIIFPIPIPIKAKYVMIGLMALDLFGGINPQYGSGVAHFAHIGGALIGFILVITMNKNNRRTFY